MEELCWLMGTSLCVLTWLSQISLSLLSKHSQTLFALLYLKSLAGFSSTRTEFL